MTDAPDKDTLDLLGKVLLTPRRVVINSDGDAVPYAIARDEHDIVPDIIFVRNDGWTLGAPRHLMNVAALMWPKDWVWEIEVTRMNEDDEKIEGWDEG